MTLARPAVLLLGAQEDVIDLGTVLPADRGQHLLLFDPDVHRQRQPARRGRHAHAAVRDAGRQCAQHRRRLDGHQRPLWPAQLGVVGSALGAATGRFVGGVLVIAILLKGRAGIRLRLAGLRPDWDLIRRILRVGLPTGMEQLLFRTGHMVFARILAELGTVAYAANQVAINAWSLSFMPGFGFALAATTLVGQSLGAQRSGGRAAAGLHRLPHGCRP